MQTVPLLVSPGPGKDVLFPSSSRRGQGPGHSAPSPVVDGGVFGRKSGRWEPGVPGLQPDSRLAAFPSRLH